MSVRLQFPAAANRGRHHLKAGNAIHLCIRNAREEQTPTKLIGTLETAASCLKAVPVVSGQWLVASQISRVAGYWPLLSGFLFRGNRFGRFLGAGVS